MDPKIDKIKLAIKNFYKQQAGGKVGAGRCDSCNDALVPGETYQCANRLWCEKCTDRTLNEDVDWTAALKNLDAY